MFNKNLVFQGTGAKPIAISDVFGNSMKSSEGMALVLKWEPKIRANYHLG